MAVTRSTVFHVHWDAHQQMWKGTTPDDDSLYTLSASPAVALNLAKEMMTT